METILSGFAQESETADPFTRVMIASNRLVVSTWCKC